MNECLTYRPLRECKNFVTIRWFFTQSFMIATKTDQKYIILFFYRGTLLVAQLVEALR
jgi:hypothetical protein